MRRVVWALVAMIGGLAQAAPALKERPPAGPGLTGDWEATALTFGGRPLNINGIRTGFRFTADGKYGQINGGRPPEQLSAFVADPTAWPAAIDFMDDNKPGGPVMVGIYRVDGDNMTLCLAAAGQPRPTEFTPAAGTLYELRRVASGE